MGRILTDFGRWGSLKMGVEAAMARRQLLMKQSIADLPRCKISASRRTLHWSGFQAAFALARIGV